MSCLLVSRRITIFGNNFNPVFMKKVYIALAAILLLAASVTAVLSFRSYNRIDEFFRANLDALSQTEKVDVKICYISTGEGPWEVCLLCDSKTSTSTLYSCPQGESYGYKSSTSYCLK